mgnify:FL=1
MHTIFVHPQLYQLFEREARVSLAQEAPNDPHYKQIPQRYHSMKYPR